LPKKLIGDLAYDSDPLDEELRQNHRVELIAPHKKNRSKTKTQDGRAFRRYRRRWKIERLFACTTSVAWLRVGNITMTTSSAWCNLHVFSSC